MAAAQGQKSAILYQSADREITLVDIPASIATAQGRCDTTLLSTSPLEHPIHFKEDYQSKAGKSTAVSSIDTVHHELYKSLIQQALLDISAHVLGSWCAPREILPQLSQHGKHTRETEDPERELERRFREWATFAETAIDDTLFDFQTMMASLGAPEVQAPTAGHSAQPWAVRYFPGSENTAQSSAATADWIPAFHNADNHSMGLSITQERVEKERALQRYYFTIPARSTFFLGDCSRPEAFRSLFRKMTDEHNLPRHFDLILLDPPWPNRSAKRKGAYEQIGGMPYLKKMLFKMDVDNYLEQNALVGIWITNKPALRDHVLGPGGLFETWNVGLVEEWIWVKTTTRGEPMFDIDDPMRKPYEVLLLGRAAPNAWTRMTHVPNARRRVIAAVPDVHSRKPCLKEMLEPYMPDPDDYSALEIFARYLVAGWASWGNEVLKYNSDLYWTKGEGEQ
ncbi:uncharacterized protein EKO05_0001357 [Ascochyta rabiei]|uniref:Methyltransferase n=1 Tax=Didymella rabiei TaxID=5454 RepID=A0A163LHN9_DIDRA|nr:uncharacterized protein EKO05_0001357 [Ascochyta rabiei]KZM27808.1 methyltransferase [Ascochyta rabiei]UPX10715.1 hypothetical protein EKO05_0001357 [Ascochyta rabiei]